MKKLTNIFAMVIFSVIFFSCANPKPPSGGEPDRTPPKVVKFYPENFQTNFDGNEIRISFNKWVDRGSVVSNIVINPPVKYKVSWSGKTIKINFLEPLKPLTTYSFLLGSDYTDLDKNKAQEPLNIVFSTSEKIDSGVVVGQVIASDYAKVYVYLVPFGEQDSLINVESRFYYIIQPNSQGFFKFQAIKEAKYVVFCFRDNNNNRTFDYKFDDFGVCTQPVFAGKLIQDTVLVFLGKNLDYIPPLLVDAKFVSERNIKLDFSEDVLFHDTLIESVQLVDTVSKDVFVPKYVIRDWSDSKSINLFFLNKLPQSVFKLQFQNAFVFFDSAGNNFEVQKIITLKLPENISEPIPDILFPTKLTISSPYERIRFHLNKPIDTIRTKGAVLKLIQPTSSDTLVFVPNFVSNLEIAFNLQNLKWDTRYKMILKIDSLFDDIGKINVHIRREGEIVVLPEISFGKLKGTLSNIQQYEGSNPKIMLFNKNFVYVAPVMNGQWELSSIPVGNYALLIFDDKNNNEQLDFGRPVPLIFSEKILKYIANISIQRGWTIEVLNL